LQYLLRDIFGIRKHFPGQDGCSVVGEKSRNNSYYFVSIQLLAVFRPIKVRSVRPNWILFLNGKWLVQLLFMNGMIDHVTKSSDPIDLTLSLRTRPLLHIAAE